MDELKHFCVWPGEGEGAELSGSAMDAIVEAVGKEKFRRYFADMIKQAFDDINLGVARAESAALSHSVLWHGYLGMGFSPHCTGRPGALKTTKPDEYLRWGSALQFRSYPWFMTISCSWQGAFRPHHPGQLRILGYQGQRRDHQ